MFGLRVRKNMDVDKSLVQIFIETKIPKGIEQIGTGVFLSFQSEPFLFTAAHVTDGSHHGNLLVPTENGLEEIEGYLAHIDLPPELLRQDDSVDMAYYRLSSDFARRLCANFLPLIKKTEIIQSSLNLGALSVVGYPISKAKKKADVFTSELAYYRGVAAAEDVYIKHDLHTEQNIIIQFNKKNAVSPETLKKINPPGPRGVSGGAIFAWPTGHEISQDWSMPTLIGILHSYKERDGLFIGTSLVPYLAGITLGRMKGYGGIS